MHLGEVQEWSFTQGSAGYAKIVASAEAIGIPLFIGKNKSPHL